MRKNKLGRLLGRSAAVAAMGAAAAVSAIAPSGAALADELPSGGEQVVQPADYSWNSLPASGPDDIAETQREENDYSWN